MQAKATSDGRGIIIQLSLFLPSSSWGSQWLNSKGSQRIRKLTSVCWDRKPGKKTYTRDLEGQKKVFSLGGLFISIQAEIRASQDAERILKNQFLDPIKYSDQYYKFKHFKNPNLYKN